MKRTFRLLALIGALAVAAAAMPTVAGAQGVADRADDQPSAGKIPVRVFNHNTLDVTVYVLAGGQAFRLGTVTSFGSASFTLPAIAATASGLQLLADPIGQASEYATEPFTVTAGQQVDWTIENNLSHSTVWVS